MARTILLALTLLASAAWLQAQSQYPQNNSGQTGSATSGSSGQTTVQGCLQGSSGNYTLTSDSGTTYQLSGDTSKLDKHVGHEVEITGTPSGSSSAATPSGGTNPSSSSSTSSSGASQSLNVDNVKHISKTCKNTNK